MFSKKGVLHSDESQRVKIWNDVNIGMFGIVSFFCKWSILDLKNGPVEIYLLTRKECFLDSPKQVTRQYVWISDSMS